MALIRKPADIKTVVIAGATTGAYAAGQQVGLPVEVKNAVLESGGIGTLLSLSVLDPAKQDAALDIILFSQAPSVGADKSNWAPTAADLTTILGVVKVSATTPYSDGTARSVGTITNLKLKLKATKVSQAQNNSSIWVLVVSRGTPNYGASAATLALQVGIDQD